MDLHACCILAEMSAHCRGAACSCLLLLAQRLHQAQRSFEIGQRLSRGYQYPLMQRAGACRAGTWPLTAL